MLLKIQTIMTLYPFIARNTGKDTNKSHKPLPLLLTSLTKLTKSLHKAYTAHTAYIACIALTAIGRKKLFNLCLRGGGEILYL